MRKTVWLDAYNRHFLSGGEPMTIDECEQYIEQHAGDVDEFSKVRMDRVKEHLNVISKAYKAQLALKEKWRVLATEYVDLTKKWEAAGAYFKTVESMVSWYYKDTKFLVWFSGGHVENLIVKARQADNVFEELKMEHNRSDAIDAI